MFKNAKCLAIIYANVQHHYVKILQYLQQTDYKELLI